MLQALYASVVSPPSCVGQPSGRKDTFRPASGKRISKPVIDIILEVLHTYVYVVDGEIRGQKQSSSPPHIDTATSADRDGPSRGSGTSVQR